MEGDVLAFLAGQRDLMGFGQPLEMGTDPVRPVGQHHEKDRPCLL